MSKPFVFDQPHATRYMDARQGFLRELLPEFKEALGLRSALDVGCGIGFFSGFLREMGFRVVAFDGRPENIEEARRRNPGVDFRVADAEDPKVQELGSFDLVLCFGLLYHLENPLRAFRNLRALTGKLLLVESTCVPEEAPILYLRDEPHLEDQGLNALGCYPSEGGLIKMAYRAGFSGVYRFARPPDHEEFRDGLGRKRSRTVLAASPGPLSFPFLVVAPEPTTVSDLWSTDRTGVTRMFQRLGRFLRRPWPEKLAAVRRRYGPG